MRDKAGTRRRLTEAALFLFATQGYEETTSRQIAEAAHVTERSFFKHFAVKADAIVDLSPERLEVLAHEIRDAPDDLPDVIVLERAVTDWYEDVRDLEAVREQARLLVGASDRSVVIRGRVSDYLDECVGTARQALANRRGEASPSPETEILASVVLKAHQQIIRHWIAGAGDFRDEAEVTYRVLNQAFGEAGSVSVLGGARRRRAGGTSRTA